MIGQSNLKNLARLKTRSVRWVETNTITEIPKDLWRIPPKDVVAEPTEFAKDGEPSNVTHQWPKASYFNRTHWRLLRPKHRFQRPYPDTGVLTRYEKKHKKSPWYHSPATSEDYEEHPLAAKLRNQTDPEKKMLIIQEGVDEVLAQTQIHRRKVWKRHEWHRVFYHLGFNEYLLRRLRNKMPFAKEEVNRKNVDKAMRYVHKNLMHQFLHDAGHPKHVRRIFRGYPHNPMYWHRFDHEKFNH